MVIGNRTFDTKHHTYIMGIMNVTPDSFSDGGKYSTMDSYLYRAQEMIAEGADIIDIGGESTRPGYVEISVDEEIQRVLPVIEQMKRRFDIPISLDTYKSEVARAGIEAGVDMINDIWGLKKDSEMANIISQGHVACCLMHNRAAADYKLFIKEVLEDVASSIRIAKEAGIEESKIMVDPGVGFAKDYEQNLDVLRHISEFQNLGYPVLLGVSRKSVIGLTLQVPVEERLSGTLALSAYGMMQGCSFLRVHDVKENKEVITMLEFLKQ